MRVRIPTTHTRIVERLFAGWNGEPLFCIPVYRGYLVTTERLREFDLGNWGHFIIE